MHFIVLLIAIIFITGCSTKAVYKTVEVKVPVKCNYKIPKKPVYNANNFDSAKALTQYYLQIEEGLYQCIGENNGQ